MLKKLSYICRYIAEKKKGLLPIYWQQTLISIGAGEMNRTPDLLITNELLYRLSYTGFRSVEHVASREL